MSFANCRRACSTKKCSETQIAYGRKQKLNTAKMYAIVFSDLWYLAKLIAGCPKLKDEA